MAIKFTGNVSYEGKKPFVEREEYATLAAMKAQPELSLNEGLIAYNMETKSHYMFKSENSVDETTGKWRKIVILDEKAKEALALKADVKEVTVESTGLTHKIKVGDTVVGTIDIPKDLFAKEFSYDADSKKIKITVSNADGSNPTILEVSVADFVKEYTAANGVELTGTQFTLSAEMQGLPARVATLEGKNHYELGFTATGNKTPVKEEGNKLYVEIPEAKAIEKATAEKDGLLSKEDFSKLQDLEQKLFVMTQSEYDGKKQSSTLPTDSIIFIKD